MKATAEIPISISRKKKAKKISELTKDITEYLDENLKLNINVHTNKKYKIAYHRSLL